jgi:hypothetical protein
VYRPPASCPDGSAGNPPRDGITGNLSAVIPYLHNVATLLQQGNEDENAHHDGGYSEELLLRLAGQA